MTDRTIAILTVLLAAGATGAFFAALVAALGGCAWLCLAVFLGVTLVAALTLAVVVGGAWNDTPRPGHD